MPAHHTLPYNYVIPVDAMKLSTDKDMCYFIAGCSESFSHLSYCALSGSVVRFLLLRCFPCCQIRTVIQIAPYWVKPLQI